jgi:hypothetical protein
MPRSFFWSASYAGMWLRVGVIAVVLALVYFRGDVGGSGRQSDSLHEALESSVGTQHVQRRIAKHVRHDRALRHRDLEQV